MDRSPTVLVVDDQVSSRDATARVLREPGWRVVTAVDGQEALERAASEHPDAVVSDVIMPRMGGLELAAALKQRALAAREFLPVLLLSSRQDPQSRAEGLRAGADDYVGKPYDAGELRARVEAFLRTRRQFEDARRGQAAEEASPLDALTGLYNQQYLTRRLEEEFRRAERYNEPLSLMAIDLDGFEDVNTRWGRGVGDRLLEACARTLGRACRQMDVVTRAGGDEFVVVLPNTHFASSMVTAERVWRDLAATATGEHGERVTCAASVGVACYPSKDVATARDLLRFAHAALARAKAEGRGKICLYQHQGYLFSPSP